MTRERHDVGMNTCHRLLTLHGPESGSVVIAPATLEPDDLGYEMVVCVLARSSFCPSRHSKHPTLSTTGYTHTQCPLSAPLVVTQNSKRQTLTPSLLTLEAGALEEELGAQLELVHCPRASPLLCKGGQEGEVGTDDLQVRRRSSAAELRSFCV